MLKFIKLRKKHLSLVSRWRRSPAVTNNMLTDIDDSKEKQHIWYNQLVAKDNYKFWIISYDEILIGAIYLDKINKIKKECELGFYIGEPSYNGIGGLILPYVYNYLFSEKRMNKINGDVMSHNKLIMNIHMLHGWSIIKDINIKKNGINCVMHKIVLSKENWLSLENKYKSFIAHFENQ